MTIHAMRCDEAREAVWLALDGEPLPEEAARHAARCGTCRAAEEDRRRIEGTWCSLGEETPGPALRDRVLRAAGRGRPARRRWAWGAAAAAAALLAFLLGPPKQAPPGPAPAKASVPVDASAMYEAARASVDQRLAWLEWDLSPSGAAGEGMGLDDVRRRIETLEKWVTPPPDGGRPPGQGRAPPRPPGTTDA